MSSVSAGWGELWQLWNMRERYPSLKQISHWAFSPGLLWDTVFARSSIEEAANGLLQQGVYQASVCSL